MAPSESMQHQQQPLLNHQRQQTKHVPLAAEYADATPPASQVPAPVPSGQHQDKYQDVSSISPRKPLTPFDADSDTELEVDNEFLDLEDGYIPHTITTGEPDWNANGKGWWGVKDIMTRTVRFRRTESLDSTGSTYREEGKRLLDGKNPKRRSGRRNWFNHCLFGGISGLTILAILLATNLILTLITYYTTTPDPDDIFLKWGGLNTGTSGLSWYPTDFTRDIQPIACHSHNDYWRRVPLFSALRHGCTGVEADVWLRNDDLLVGHNTASLTPNRTFTSLYIDPLVRILESQNSHSEFYKGTSNGVFDVDPEQTLTLLIDVKTSGKETWPWILKQLEPLRERGWLTYMADGKVHKRQVTVVGTGNTRFDVLTENESYRDIFFDAPLDTMWESEEISSSLSNTLPALPTPDSSTSPPARNADGDQGQGLSGTSPTSSFTPLNSYYASVSLPKAIGHIWRFQLSPKQLEIIRGQVRGAHRRGLKARYWDLPAWPIGLRDHVWKVLVDEGCDVLNVDDLRGAASFTW